MKNHILILSIALLCMKAFSQVPYYVPTNGLVGWWPFNGNANDESGIGNNGSVNGATLTVDRFGVANKAYSFDGLSNYIDLGNPAVLGNNPTSYTQAGWVFFFDFSDAFVFMSKRHDNSGNDWATPVAGINGKFIFFADDAFYTNAPLAQSNVLLVNQWYHVVFVKSLNDYSIYVDGVLIDNLNEPHVMGGSTNNLLIGAQLAWPEFFKGKIDDVGVWNRALTACEIQDLYNSQMGITSLSNHNACDNYMWNGINYTQSGQYTYSTASAVTGCDSTAILDLTINNNTSSTQTQTALDSYMWPVNGQTYNQSGIYTAIIPNYAGCDSTITLELSLDFTGIEDLNTNPSKKLLKITDLNGKETPFRKNTILLFIYQDGTVERVFEAE